MNINKILLANKKETLPVYLYPTDPNKLDIYNYVINYDELNFSQFKEDIQKEYPDINWNLRDNIHVISPFYDVYLLWLFTRKNFSIEVFIGDEDNKEFIEICKDKLPGIDLENYYTRNKERYLEDINFQIRENREVIESYDKFNALMKEEIQFQNDYKIFPENYNIKIEKMTMIIPIDTEYSTIELFNELTISNRIPFCYCEDYIKIFQNFNPKDLNFSKQNKIFGGYFCIKNNLINRGARLNNQSDIKILCGQVFSTSENMYSEWAILPASDITQSYENFKYGKEQLCFNLRLKFSSQTIDYVKIPDVIMNSFVGSDGISIDKKNILYSNINTTFYVKNIENLNIYIFKDMLMHDKNIRNIVKIDDNSGANKIHISDTGDFSNRFMIKFSDLKYGELRAIVHYIIPNKESKPSKLFGLAEFPIGIPYLDILLSSENVDSIVNFIKVFQGLLNYYSKYATKEIINEYKSFIDDFEYKTKFEKIDKEISLRKMFRNAYPPKGCSQNAYLQLAEKGDPDAIKFPRDVPPDNLDIVKYDTDGYQQHYVKCDKNSDFPFVGVKTNSTERPVDGKFYDYIPCCFQQEQHTSNAWRHYYDFEEIVERESRNIVKEGKMLKPKQKGYFTTSSFFNSLINKTEGEFLRIGVFKSNLSLLHCVLFAIDENYKSTDDKESYAQDELKKLIQNYHYGLQSHYMTEHKIIIDNMSDSENYFDPRMQICLLENYYNVNIYVFNNTFMISPLYIEGYYKDSKFLNYPTIFVYENTGNKSFIPKIPQCELIFYQSFSKQNQYVFDKESEIVPILQDSFIFYNKNIVFDNNMFSDLVYVDNFFDESTKLTILSSVKPTLEPTKLTILSQRIDNYGKCRGISFLWKNTPMTINTSPMPIMKAPMRNNEYHYSTAGVIESFANEMGDKIGRINENTFTYQNMTFEILKTPYGDDDTGLKKQSDDYIQTFINNRRNARYIVQIFMKTFAEWVLSNQLPINDNTLNEFITNKIVINKNFKYEKIYHTIEQNKHIFDNNKLIITSEELLKRLIYVLQLSLKNDTKLVLSLKERVYLQNYYSDIADFTTRPNQIIIKDLANYQTNWYQNNYVLRTLPEITGSLNSSYFLNIIRRISYDSKNFFTEDATTFLAQTSLSLSEVQQLGIFYKKNKYNINFVEKKENIDDISYNIFEKLNDDVMDNTFICSKYDKNADLDIIQFGNTYTVLMTV